MSKQRFKFREHALLAHDLEVRGVIQKAGKRVEIMGIGAGNKYKVELNHQMLWLKFEDLVKL